MFGSDLGPAATGRSASSKSARRKDDDVLRTERINLRSYLIEKDLIAETGASNVFPDKLRVNVSSGNCFSL